MKPLIKVDRISSVEEAVQLQKLGVDIIGISLDTDSRFRDCRYVTLDTAREIRDALESSFLCCELKSTDLLITLSGNCNLDFVQCPNWIVLESEFRENLKKKNISLIYSNAQADHDDDPGWIVYPLPEQDSIISTIYQVNLLADVYDSWNYLKYECPKYREFIQIAEINNLASEHLIIISIDFDKFNILEIIDAFPKIYGINFTLGEETTRTSEDFHWIRYDKLLEILTLINNNKV